jgi:hypothetical protein
MHNWRKGAKAMEKEHVIHGMMRGEIICHGGERC